MLVFEKLELNVEGMYRYLGDFSPASFFCTTAAAATCQDVGVGVCVCNTLAAVVKVCYCVVQVITMGYRHTVKL